MSRHPAARDLGQDTQRRMGELLERQIGIAQHVLEPVDLILLMIEVAVSTCLTASATAAATVEDRAKAPELFDQTLGAISALALGDRERSLMAIAHKRQAAGRAA